MFESKVKLGITLTVFLRFGLNRPFESKVKLGITLTNYKNSITSTKFESKVKLGITLTLIDLDSILSSLRVK